MGSYTTLEIAGYPIVESKSDVVPEMMTLFRESDRRTLTRRVNQRNPLVWSVSDTSKETEEVVEYSCEVRVAIDRLNVMGFTMQRAGRSFEQGRQFELASLVDADDASEWSREWRIKEREVLSTLDFDCYLKCLAVVLAGKLTSNRIDDSDSPALDRQIKYILGDSHERTLGFFGEDDRLLVRVLCDLVDPGAMLVQDISDLVGSGYYRQDEPVCQMAISRLTDDYPENVPRIVLTEGSTDAAILRDALTILYPHLEGYFSFMDFDSARTPGGAGHLVSIIKAFAGAGIANHIIALFDNDTAAQEAVRALALPSLPKNIAVLHYPALEFLRSYPTVGPSGPSTMDVNGLAGSIELYLGEDVLGGEDGTLTRVRWKGYSDAFGRYHGEVADKTRLHARFREKVARYRADPSAFNRAAWSGLDAVLQTMFRAFE